MTIWFPTNSKLAIFDPHSFQRKYFSNIRASHTSELDTVSAIGDERTKVVQWKNVPRWTSRPQLGQPVVEAEFLN